jgi:predicted HNH restriction endonuclease
MGKRLPGTPRSRVRSAIRQLFLRSRERAACLKAAGYTCAACGVKQSKAKGREVAVEVHHRDGIGNWEKVIDLIFEEILCSPDRLEVLCKECHAKAEVCREVDELLP